MGSHFTMADPVHHGDVQVWAVSSHLVVALDVLLFCGSISVWLCFKLSLKGWCPPHQYALFHLEVPLLEQIQALLSDNTIGAKATMSVYLYQVESVSIFVSPIHSSFTFPRSLSQESSPANQEA